MSRIHVIDNSGYGLQISPSARFSFWRHSSWCEKLKWDVTLHPPSDIGEFLGGQVSRAAVVDDFGSLVFVGDPR